MLNDLVFICNHMKLKKKWSIKYKKSINCKRPKGFSQKQHCKYRKTYSKYGQSK